MHQSRGARLPILLALALLVAAATASHAGGAATSVTISATVASATMLDASACASGTAGVTDLGAALPGSPVVSGSDCSVAFGSSNDTSMLRVAQSDGTGVALTQLPDGRLDSSFDADGKTTSALLSRNDLAYGVAIQADGKYVLGGTTFNGVDYEFGLARYNPDGSLDLTFDGDGKVATPILAGNDTGRALAVQGDGKIILAGYAHNGTNNDYALARYNSDGSLDTSFDGDGKVTANIGGADYIDSIGIQSDGRIVVSGSSSVTTTDFSAMRFNPDGSADTTFDDDGKVMTAVLAGTDVARGQVILPSGKIVLSGSAHDGTANDFAAVRYNPDGTLDTTFHLDGKVSTPVLAGSDTAFEVAAQADGRIVLAGAAHNGVDNDVALVRYNGDGSLDTTFDGDGIRTDPVLASNDSPRALVILADGRIVVAGHAHNGTNQDVAVLRYRADGSLDPSFDADGKVVTPIGSANDEAYGIAIERDGRIVVAGASVVGSEYDFSVVRYGLGGTVADWSGSWSAPALFAGCLHTVGGGAAASAWPAAGTGNCTTSLDANWNALPTTAVTLATAGSGVTGATTNLRFGFKGAADQRTGAYSAPLRFEVLAPSA